MKTYRATRHDAVRLKQKNNDEEVHHPIAKSLQIDRVIGAFSGLKILELFAGQGNLTGVYHKFGSVECYDRKYLHTGDSYLVFHRLIYEKKIYDVIDIDPYGFPNRFFPDIFLLIEEGFMFITMPKPFVNILNGITATHLMAYYEKENPSLDRVLLKLKHFGLCHWRDVYLLEYLETDRMWRFAFHVSKVKATEFTGVKNRP